MQTASSACRSRSAARPGQTLPHRKRTGAFDDAELETVADPRALGRDRDREMPAFCAGTRAPDALERANTGLGGKPSMWLAIGDAAELQLLLALITQRARTVVGATLVVLITGEGDRWELAARSDDAVRAARTSRWRACAIPGDGAGRSPGGGDGAPARSRGLHRCSCRCSIAEPPLGALIARGPRAIAPSSLEPELSGRCARWRPARQRRSHPPAPWQRDACAQTLAAAEGERRRWARELHDETLQGLGALRLALRGALRSATRPALGAARAGGAAPRPRDRWPAGDHSRSAPAALDDLGLASARARWPTAPRSGQAPPCGRRSHWAMSGWIPNWRPLPTASARRRSPTRSSMRARRW